MKDGIRRYSDAVRWRVQVKKVCRKLGRYTCADVNCELRTLARLAWRRDRMGPSRAMLARSNTGFYMPTNRELAKYLSVAEWSIEVVPGDKHHQAVYEYRNEEKAGEQ